MSTVSNEPATGLALAFELSELGLRIREQRYRREHRNASDEEVETFIRAWLLDRPGAPFGDGPGRPVPWPRPTRG